MKALILKELDSLRAQFGHAGRPALPGARTPRPAHVPRPGAAIVDTARCESLEGFHLAAVVATDNFRRTLSAACLRRHELLVVRRRACSSASTTSAPCAAPATQTPDTSRVRTASGVRRRA
eukprot:Rhum_TRINITY_DN15319_c4_g1::Rhum_TRINITY_DN15319_c4_g1_i2::g.150695::m.150695